MGTAEGEWGGGGGRGFLGGISKFLERDDGGLPNVLTAEEGGLLIFVPLVKKGIIFLWIFFL